VSGLLITIHRHALRVPAKLSLGRGRDGTARVTDGAAFLEGKQLLGSEALVVDLRRGFNQVLEVGAGQEVAEIDEFAMVLVLDWEKAG
jgi:hypothetical protein